MPAAATTQKFIDQESTSTAEEEAPPAPSVEDKCIKIVKDGPYLVSGTVPLVEEAIVPEGGHLKYRKIRTFPTDQSYALCRCGHTTTPPFCDGSHKQAGFDGTETASRKPYVDRADVIEGEEVYLLDDNRCAYARFCHREDGDVWTLTERSGNKRLKEEAIKASSDCPSGRLVHYDARNDVAYEHAYQPTISIMQDPGQGVSGPLFVRGGIPLVGADGEFYELRNRYALCRCGASHDKPFCDAMHVTIGFEDGLEG